MSLSLSDLRTCTKQALGNRQSSVGITINDAWYTARVNTGYRRLTTFQGMVDRPGIKRPQFRILRFFELEDRRENSIEIPGGTPTNFITPTTTTDPTDVVYIMDVYDRTNNRPIVRTSRRDVLTIDPDSRGRPTRWCPAGEGGAVGYYIDRIPAIAADECDVFEYVYLYPPALVADIDVPVIPESWHTAIWYAAVAEGATLLDWPEKVQEYEGLFKSFIAERKSPYEEAAFSGLSGTRRNIPVRLDR